MKSISVCIAASTALLAATSSFAADPGGPKSHAPQDISDWIAAKIEPAGWRYLYFDADGAYFSSPQAPSRTNEGDWRLVVREELFVPDAAARSMVMQTELDCTRRRLRLPGIRAFSEHNLRGGRQDRPPIMAWVSPETPTENAQIDQLCGLVRTGATAAQPQDAPPPASLAAADIRRWSENYLELSGWTVIGSDPDGVNLATRSGATRLHDLARIWTRVEFFHVQAYPDRIQSRSARQLIEVDCKGLRTRIVRIEAHPFNNLRGELTQSIPSAGWRSALPGSGQVGTVRTLCRLADAIPATAARSPPAAATARPVRLRPPQPKAKPSSGG